MDTKNIIDKLKSLGFKEYEARAFLVLLRGVPMSASSIAKEAKIIRNSIYDILKSFVEKGYCNEIETNTILNYQIIDPQIILDKIEKDYRAAFNSNVSLLKETFGELQTMYKTKTEHADTGETAIELIRGFNKHRVAKYTDLLKRAKHEVNGMYRLKGLVSEELNELSERLIKKGGAIQSIYEVSEDFKIIRKNKVVPAEHEDMVRVFETFESAGEQVRLSITKIPNITVFDSETVFINMSGGSVPKNKQADIIIKNPEFAEHMKNLFTFYWEKSMTVEEFKQNKSKVVFLKSGNSE